MSSNRTHQQKNAIAETFTRIYLDGSWGDGGHEFPMYSGPGSHDPVIVETYVTAVRTYFTSQGIDSPSIVDIGCGDFNIGSRFLDVCSRYIACDVAAPVIEQNRQKYNHPALDFRILNACEDQVPSADVIFIRQVLQHLSNRSIIQLLGNIKGKCKYLIVTEHLPTDPAFTSNLDKPDDQRIRLRLNSGVRLTAAPFNLQVLSDTVLCTAPQLGGIIETRAYCLDRAEI